MGLGAHVLGDKKLAALQRKTGLTLNRAFRRNDYTEGITWHPTGGCTHYAINWDTGEYKEITVAAHFTSCPKTPHIEGKQP